MYSIIDILKALHEHRYEIYPAMGQTWREFLNDLKAVLTDCSRVTDIRELKKASMAIREICFRYTVVKNIILDNRFARNVDDKKDIPSVFEIRKQIQSLLLILEKDAPENVRFTFFSPEEAIASQWYTGLVYIHLDSILDKVREDSRKFLEEMGNTPHMTTSCKASGLVRGTEIRIALTAEGVEFNPPQTTIQWNEDVQRIAFRFRSASPGLAGRSCFGEMEAMVGPIVIARVRFSIFFIDPAASCPNRLNSSFTEKGTGMYKKIFASYSHKDTNIVKKCTQAYKALGDDILIDKNTIKSGECWKESLKQMIEQADIFQLFWSTHSALSQQVTSEWRWALCIAIKKAQTEGFIRPVYWEKPLPKVPSELAHVHFKYMSDLAII